MYPTLYERYGRYERHADAPTPYGQRPDLRCYEVLSCPSEAGHGEPTPAPSTTATAAMAGLDVAGGWSPPGSRTASRSASRSASRTASPVERAALGVLADRAAGRRPLGVPVGTFDEAAAAARHPGAVAFVAPGEPWAPLEAAVGGALLVGDRVVTPDNFEPLEVRYRHPKPRRPAFPVQE